MVGGGRWMGGWVEAMARLSQDKVIMGWSGGLAAGWGVMDGCVGKGTKTPPILHIYQCIHTYIHLPRRRCWGGCAATRGSAGPSRRA